MESSEHHILKDLPFYEEARTADVKARQDQLERRENKHQEDKLRQALGKNHPTTSSTVLLQTKEKLVSRSAREALDLFSSTSSPTSYSETGTNQGSIGSPSIGARPNQEFDPVVPCIILELKKKKKKKR